MAAAVAWMSGEVLGSGKHAHYAYTVLAAAVRVQDPWAGTGMGSVCTALGSSMVVRSTGEELPLGGRGSKADGVEVVGGTFCVLPCLLSHQLIIAGV